MFNCDSSVGTATTLQPQNQKLVPFAVGKRLFFFSTMSISALRPTTPPTHHAPEDLQTGVKRPQREADDLPSSSVQVYSV